MDDIVKQYVEYKANGAPAEASPQEATEPEAKPIRFRKNKQQTKRPRRVYRPRGGH